MTPVNFIFIQWLENIEIKTLQDIQDTEKCYDPYAIYVIDLAQAFRLGKELILLYFRFHIVRIDLGHGSLI